jgi:hypothetical protein
MNLKTYPLFYYGFEIDATNNAINFNEGTGEIAAYIQTGSYSAEQLVDKIKTAMDSASLNARVYFVTFNRSTRKVSISCSSAFDLLCDTGLQSGVAVWDLIGFATDSDKTGALTYTSDDVAGSQYIPQFLLQDFKHPNQTVKYIDSTVNESSNGEIQTVSFGLRRFLRFSLKFITNEITDGYVIRYNPSGYDDAILFLKFLIKKGPFEMMLDESNPTQYFTLILESTGYDSSGVGYELNAMTSNNLPDFYETGLLTFRVVE